MNHKKLIIVAIRVGLIGTLTTLGWELPIQSVSHPDCEKGVHWDDMSEDCKLSLTDHGAVSEQTHGYGHLLLSALRGASYNRPHTPNSGSHPSLDIVSTEGTPVNTIAAGTVVLAGPRSGFGNSVTVQHDLDGEKIYSNYSHLEKITVSVGQKVKQGELIGTVGRTGFTIGPFGYHLDFQITTADSPSHPYGLHDCETAYYEAVNSGDCKDKVEKYTIDPVVFFQKYSAYDLTALTPQGISTKTTQKESQEHRVAPKEELTEREEQALQEELKIQQDVTETPIPVAFNVNKSIFASLVGTYTERTTQQNSVTTALAGETKADSKVDTTQDNVAVDSGLPYEINWIIGNKTGEITAGKIAPLTFFITDQTKARFDGALDERVHITFNDHELDIMPKGFSNVVDGKKTLFVRGKQAGYASITLRHGEEELGTEVILIK